MKTALVHDDLVQAGGAERVVAALHELYPDAPLYTSVYDRRTTLPEFRRMDVRTSFLQRTPLARGACTNWPCPSSRPRSRGSTCRATTWSLVTLVPVRQGRHHARRHLPRLLLSHAGPVRLAPARLLRQRPHRPPAVAAAAAA